MFGNFFCKSNNHLENQEETPQTTKKDAINPFPTTFGALTNQEEKKEKIQLTKEEAKEQFPTLFNCDFYVHKQFKRDVTNKLVSIFEDDKAKYVVTESDFIEFVKSTCSSPFIVQVEYDSFAKFHFITINQLFNGYLINSNRF